MPIVLPSDGVYSEIQLPQEFIELAEFYSCLEDVPPFDEIAEDQIKTIEKAYSLFKDCGEQLCRRADELIDAPPVIFNSSELVISCFDNLIRLPMRPDAKNLGFIIDCVIGKPNIPGTEKPSGFPCDMWIYTNLGVAGLSAFVPVSKSNFFELIN